MSPAEETAAMPDEPATPEPPALDEPPTAWPDLPVAEEEPEPEGDHDVPAELVELHEVLEWQAAVEAEQP